MGMTSEEHSLRAVRTFLVAFEGGRVAEGLPLSELAERAQVALAKLTVAALRKEAWRERQAMSMPVILPVEALAALVSAGRDFGNIGRGVPEEREQ